MTPLLALVSRRASSALITRAATAAPLATLCGRGGGGETAACDASSTKEGSELLQRRGFILNQLSEADASSSRSGSGSAASCSGRGLLIHSLPGRQRHPLAASGGGACLAAFGTATTGNSKLAAALRAPPRSLQFDRGEVAPPKELDNMFGQMLMKVLGLHSHRSKLLQGGQVLYNAVKQQAKNPAVLEAFGLDPAVFYSSWVLLASHVWLVVNRLKDLNDGDGKFFKQRFYAQFQSDVEHSIYVQGVQIGVSKWTGKLEKIFFSAGLAFDKALRGEGSETFEDSVLRHFYGNEADKRPYAALLAQYLRREHACLQMTPTEDILRGHVRFSTEPFAMLQKH